MTLPDTGTCPGGKYASIFGGIYSSQFQYAHQHKHSETANCVCDARYDDDDDGAVMGWWCDDDDCDGGGDDDDSVGASKSITFIKLI